MVSGGTSIISGWEQTNLSDKFATFELALPVVRMDRCRRKFCPPPPPPPTTCKICPPLEKAVPRTFILGYYCPPRTSHPRTECPPLDSPSLDSANTSPSGFPVHPCGHFVLEQRVPLCFSRERSCAPDHQICIPAPN